MCKKARLLIFTRFILVEKGINVKQGIYYGKNCLKLDFMLFLMSLKIEPNPSSSTKYHLRYTARSPSAVYHSGLRNFVFMLPKILVLATLAGRFKVFFAYSSMFSVLAPPPTNITPAGNNGLLFIFFK